jgi:cytochrome c oxidase cbb3-type subunit 3
MSRGWSSYVIAFTIANILGCVWLLWWTARRRPGDGTEAPTTGHRWDEDLTEYNKPLPRWWLNLFYATVVFALAYLAIFPGLGNVSGTARWTSATEHAADVAAAEALLRPRFARFASQPLEQLARDPEALALGAAVFANNCATCHGSDARGAHGFPNLTDANWLWGGAPDTVLATILDGRRAVMPALGAVLGPQGVTEAAVYVQSLSGARADAALARAGEKRFQTLCAACHGANGRGNQALGAPDLRDDVWEYGGDFAAIETSIRDGRSGQMPPHRALLGAERARVAAAWVLSRSAGAAEPGPGADNAAR